MTARILTICCFSLFWLANATCLASVGQNPLEQANKAEAEHRFNEAQVLLQRAVTQNPHLPGVWLRLATVASVRGDLASAETACQHVASRLDILVTLGCQGLIELAKQTPGAAFKALHALLQHPLYASKTDPVSAWANGITAELAVQLGLEQAADYHFTKALHSDTARPSGVSNTPPGSVQVRAAWLDHLLNTARPQRVLEAVSVSELENAVQIRRLIALQQLERENEASSLRAYLDFMFRDALAQGEHVHSRDIARFFLDVIPEPQLALQAAEINLEQQREAEDFWLYRRAETATRQIAKN